MTSLSSGLKQQSVLTGIDKHQQFVIRAKASRPGRAVFDPDDLHCKVVGQPRRHVHGPPEVPYVPQFERVVT